MKSTIIAEDLEKLRKDIDALSSGLMSWGNGEIEFDKLFSDELTAAAERLADAQTIQQPMKEPKELSVEQKIDIWTNHLNKRYGDQPAGVPIPLCKPGLDVILAPAYERRFAEKKKKSKAIQQPKPWAWDKCSIDQNKSAIKGFAEYFAFKRVERWRPRNKWWSTIKNALITIHENSVTKKVKFTVSDNDRNDFKEMLYSNTYEAAVAWDIEHEQKAWTLLKELVSKEQYDRWIMTGTLIEQSKRSGLRYIFRRLRPTLVFNVTGGNSKFLSSLCHHPVGYYYHSWAGALVRPTISLPT